MRTIEQIEQEIDELINLLNNVKGTETEVYTRIVGYHRELKGWNDGKREEYKHRITYNPQKF